MKIDHQVDLSAPVSACSELESVILELDSKDQEQIIDNQVC